MVRRKMNKITFCLTSCNRFNLLQKTLDSFFNLNTYPIERFIVTEDSGNLEMKSKIEKRYGNKIELIFNNKNLGLLQSIDNMYNMVKTEYIFHCEDDWLFRNNSFFVSNSVDILDEYKNINQVWLIPGEDWLEEQLLKTKTNVQFRYVKVPHCGAWCGFSFNPGLRRLSDYKRLFPEGFIKYIVPNKAIVHSECSCNKHALKEGYRTVALINHACEHIGSKQSTYK